MLSSFREILRSLFVFEAAQLRPGTGFLRGLGVAVSVIPCAAVGHADWAVLTGLGGLYVGIASFGGVFPARLRRMVATALATAVFTTIGSLLSGSHVATIIGVGLGSGLLAWAGSVSVSASTVALLGTGVLVILSGIPTIGHHPYLNGLLVLAGGLAQTLVLSIAAPFTPHPPERKAVADAFRSLARYLQQPGEVTVPDAEPFLTAWALLDEAVRYGKCEDSAQLRHALRSAETIRATLIPVRRRLHRDRATAALQNAVDCMNFAADQIERGSFPVQVQISNEAFKADNLARSRVLFESALEELGREALPIEAQDEPTVPFVKGITNALRSTTSLRSLAVKHAIRYGLAMGVGAAIYRLGHMSYGYWVPITIAFLLRADYSVTVKRGFVRFVGTVLGVVAANSIAAMMGAAPWAMVTFMLVSAWLAFAFYQASFVVYIMFLTSYVVASLTSSVVQEQGLGYDRVIATIFGVIVTVTAAVVWPIWQSSSVNAVLKDAFDSQRAYAEAVLDAYRGGSLEPAEALRKVARKLRVNSERIVEASTLEPHRTRKIDVLEARAHQERLDENASVLLALHARVLEVKAGRLADKPTTLDELSDAIASARY